MISLFNIRFPLRTKLAGVTYGNHQENIKRWGRGDIPCFPMTREPDNPHDPNAIRVGYTEDDIIGYVPANVAQHLAPMMDSGRHFVADFVRINKSAYHDVVGITIDIVEPARR